MANEHGVDKEAVTINDVSYSSGSKKGDGFVCDIAAINFNAIIDGKVFEKNYIAKFCSEKQREYMARKVNNIHKNNVYLLLIELFRKRR